MAPGKLTVGTGGGVVPPISNVIEAARRREEQGFDNLWWPDHLMAWFPQSLWEPQYAPAAAFAPSPHVYLDAVGAMATVGASTKRVVLGPAVTDPYRRPPAVLAQDYLTLDHITQGRVILAIGAGDGCNIAPYGIPYEKPISHLEEAIKIIRLLWEHDEPVDFDGQFWKLKGAVNGLRPYQPDRYPPIWIGGAAPRTMRIVGQLADGWLPAILSFDQWKERKVWIEQAAVAARRDPSQITYGLYHCMVVDDDHELCHRMLESPLIKNLILTASAETYRHYGYEHPFGANFSGMQSYIPSQVPKERMLNLLDAVPFEMTHDVILHGTPDDIAAELDRYIAIGCGHVNLLNMTGRVDLSKNELSDDLTLEVLRYLKSKH